MMRPIEPTYVTLGIVRGYMEWWDTVRPTPLDYDDEYEDEDMDLAPSKGYSN